MRTENLYLNFVRCKVPQLKIAKDEIYGKWEMIVLSELADSVILWQGQVSGGGWNYDTLLFNNPVVTEFLKGGKIVGKENYKWKFKNDRINYFDGSENTELLVFKGWDWENKKQVILFSGIMKNGLSVYGKKIK